jgi:hypothetical protein
MVSIPSLLPPPPLSAHLIHRFILFSKQFRLLDESDLVPLQDLVTRIYEVDIMPSSEEYQSDDPKRISTVSSSICSDNVSKLTMPTIDYQGDRLLSEHSIDLSAHR